MKTIFTLSFDSWTIDREIVRTSEYQLDMGSSAKVNSPKYLIAAHQTAARSAVAKKTISLSVFAQVAFRKQFVEIDGF